MRKIAMGVTLVLLSLVLLAPPSLAQSKIVLKAGHNSSVIYPYQIGLQKLSDEVRKRTNGQIEIQIFPMGQLGDERDMTEGVRMGTIDMIVTANGMVTNFVPEAVVFDLPYLFQDQDHALRAMMSPAGQRVTKLIEQKIGKVLAFYGAGTRSIFNRVRPIQTPDDLKGLKIRVLQNKIYISTLNALGALATPLPFSEVYGALQQGVIDGAENDPPSLLGMKHYEQSKYFSMTMHFVQSGYLFMNWDRWNRLTPEHQKIIAEVAQLSQKEERDYERAKYNEALTELRRLGIQINEPNRTLFAERARSVWREIPSEYMSTVEELQKVK